MKTINICLYILLFFCFSNLRAQNSLAIKQKTFRIDVSNIESIVKANNQYYLFSSDSTFQVNESGKLMKKLSHDSKKGLYFDSNNEHSISSDGKIYKSSKEIFSVYDKLLSDNKVAKFLSKSDDMFYSCFIDPNSLSYSNGIFKIKGNDYSLFTYLVGIPAGIYTDNNYLWYLYHKSLPDSNGMLRKYDIKTGELVLEIEIPVIEPVGLFIDSNLCYVYSNHSHELVTLNIGGN